MTPPPVSSPAAPRAAMRLVCAASWLAPRPARDRFVREWEGELAWLARSNQSMLIRALSSIPHALALRQPGRGFDMLLQDIRYAARQLTASPTFTLAAILTLMLGIGANATIFSVLNSTILHPMPFRDGDRLVTVWRQVPDVGLMTSPQIDQVRQWRESVQGLEAIQVLSSRDFVMTGLQEPLEVIGTRVSPGIFDFLGVVPERGRAFTTEDLAEGRDHLAVLSNDLWRGAFGGDPEVVGRDIAMDDQTYTVIGVMPAGFRLQNPYNSTRIWLPLDEEAMARDQPDFGVLAMARLREGVTAEAVNAELAGLVDTTVTGPSSWPGVVRTAREMLGDRVATAIWSFQGAVGLVLLIACANVANLMLARSTSRRREIALRAALGASRARLLRQALVESLLLAGVGGGLGLLLASQALRAVVRLRPERLSHLETLRLDADVAIVTVVVSLLCGLVFGLLPSLYATDTALLSRLGGGARTGEPAAAGRLRGALVLAQVGLSTMLLVGAGLLIATFINARRVDPGFDADNLLAIQISIPESRYDTPAAEAQFWNDLRSGLLRSLGNRVDGLTLSLGIPPQSGVMFGDIELEGLDGWQKEESDKVSAMVQGDASYREVLRMPLLAGRYFSDQEVAAADAEGGRGEGAASTAPVVINAGLANLFGGPEQAIGKGLRFGGSESPWRPIVGVVGDVKSNGLLADLANRQFYVPSMAGDERRVIVRSSLEDSVVVDAVREQVHALDPGVPISEVSRVRAMFDADLSTQRFNAVLMGGFATMALLLAMVGIYGVLSYAVEQRRHEIGVRMALGASLPALLRTVTGRALLLVLAGLALGLAGAGILSRLIESMLHGVAGTDPLTYAIAATALLAVGIAAAWIPARRAMRTDPMVALRTE